MSEERGSTKLQFLAVDTDHRPDTLNVADPLLVLLDGKAVDIKTGESPKMRAAAQQPEMLTREQAAEMLKISTRTLGRLVSRNYVPHLRLNRRCVRFPRRALADWIEAKTQGKRS